MSKTKKVKWANITSDYVGTPYELGKMDCFTLMVDVLKDMKVDVPTEAGFGGMTMDTYKDRWLENPEETKQIMVKWLRTFADEVETKDILAGDILILEAKAEQIMFAGIYTGNNRIMSTSIERGVCISRLEYFNILEVFRCPK